MSLAVLAPDSTGQPSTVRLVGGGLLGGAIGGQLATTIGIERATGDRY